MIECGQRVVAGIDLAAGRGTTEVALLELGDGERLPTFHREAHRAVTSDDEILAVLAEARPAVIAIDAPLSLPEAVAQAVRGDTPAADDHHSSRSVGASGGRPTLGRPTPGTSSPYTRCAERDPIWAELGVRPLPVSFLGGLTFRALVVLLRLRSALPHADIIEVFPTATLRVLGIRPAAPGVKRWAKSSEPARRATQDGLARFIAAIPSPEDELLSADLLDALAAALTGAAYLQGRVVAAGDADEGQIVIPSREFGRSDTRRRLGFEGDAG